jgi:hypothetical protein
MLVLLPMLLVVTVALVVTGDKDEWLQGFEERAKLKAKEFPPGKHCNTTADGHEANCIYNLPMYLPARSTAKYTQKVPFRIFQTWKSMRAAGEHAYKTMTSFINDNPEYDYYLFDDVEALNFVCTFHPEYALLYQQTRLGAAKADLWRLMVILRYGGMYVDVDSASTVPIRDYLWRNASGVSGIGGMNDFHQWALIYTPRHHIIKHALLAATSNLDRTFRERGHGNICYITGPAALQFGVIKALKEFSCPIYTDPQFYALRGRTPKNETLDIPQPQNCLDALGVIQIYNGDFMGNHIIFKNSAADQEKDHTVEHYSYNNSFSEMFHTDVAIVPDGKYTKVGQCQVKGDSWRGAQGPGHRRHLR